MSKTQLLKAFVNERLTAAAVEILEVFERTIADYEKEVFLSKQEIQRQRKILDDQAVYSQTEPSVCEEKHPLGQQHCEPLWSPLLDQAGTEPPHIKEEEQEELWADDRGEETQDQLETTHIIQFVLPSPAGKSDREEDQTQPSQPPIQSRESVDEVWTGGSQPSVSLLKPLKSTKTQTLKRQTSGISIKDKKSIDAMHLKPANFTCKVCGKMFQYKGFLIKHLRQTHPDADRMVCGVCGENFESLESLTAHLKAHDDKYMCHVCGVCFAKNSILVAHMTCHREAKLHRCHVCGRECSRKGDLKIHMRIHTGEKPYCCSYCSKGFTHSGHLKKHLRTHTGERLYRCQVCDKGFTQTSRLVRHMDSHSECRPNQQLI